MLGGIDLSLQSMASLASGHFSAEVVAEHQPAKLAAMEAHFPASAPAGLYLFGWVDEEEQKVLGGVEVPGLLSLMVHLDPRKPVTGLNAFPKEDWPPVNATFQSYHIMIVIGMGLIGLSLLGLLLWRLGRLFEARWL